MNKIYSILLVLVFSTIAFAQAPDKMSYQAVIRDASDNLVSSSTVSLRISILKGAIDGTPVYTETHSTETNSNGLLSIEIGDGIVELGDFSEIDWSEGPYFIQTETDPEGGENYSVVGITQLLSVPYALYAGNGSLWQKRPEGITYINSLNSSSLIEKLPTIDRDIVVASDDDVSTGIRLQDYGIGGESYSIVSTNNTSDLGGGKFIIYQDSGSGSAFKKVKLSIVEGNVGIATHDPHSKLQVSDGDIYIEDINSGIILTSPDGSCWRVTIENNGDFSKSKIDCP